MTLRKIFVGGTLAAALGTAGFEAFRNSSLQDRMHALDQQQVLLGKQVLQLQQERDDATNQLRWFEAQNEKLKISQNTAELLKLRGEVARLRIQGELAQSQFSDTQSKPDPVELAAKELAGKMNLLKERLEQMPDKNIPELKYLEGKAWARVAQGATLDTDAGVRQALSSARNLAKADFAPHIAQALQAYAQANQGQLPTDASQLKPYFDLPVDDAALARYQMIATGNARELPPSQMVVAERAPVDEEYDYLVQIGLNIRKSVGVGQNSHMTESVAWSPREPLAPSTGK